MIVSRDVRHKTDILQSHTARHYNKILTLICTTQTVTRGWISTHRRSTEYIVVIIERLKAAFLCLFVTVRVEI